MRLFLFLFLLSSLCVQAQKREVLSIELRADIKNMDPQEKIHLYLRGDVDAIFTFVRGVDGKIKGAINEIVAVALPVSSLADLNDLEGLEYVEYSGSEPQMLADIMLINNNVHPIHQGVSPLPEAYFGEDVIIGFIDSGIELDHPDFQNEDGTTRVIALWDHTQEEADPFRVPEPYGYGQEWTAEDIDQGIDGHEDQPNFFGHGSTVSGVAVGNGNATGDFIGVAPQADIIVVSSDFTRTNWKASIADAVDYIFARAEELGKPAVVNASLGDYYGSHDALDAPAIFIESLLDESNGRVMVSAAGNSNGFAPYHLSYDIPETDTAFTWFTYNPNSVLGEGAVFFEFWVDSVDFYESSFSMGADISVPSYEFRGYAEWRSVESNLNTLLVDTIFWNGNIIGIVESWCGQRGDQYQFQVAVREAFSSQYKWRFATTGGGRFDCWSYGPFGTSGIENSNLPDPGVYPDIINYRYPDKEKTIVDSWACSEKVITVANYVNRNEYVNYLNEITFLPGIVPLDISGASSSGPTRDLRQKPDIAATGDIILSAGRIENLNGFIANEPDKVALGGWHYRNGGTSMASPVVAGVAGLYLDREPEAGYAEIKEAIIENALADEFTGVLPGLRWGHGKLNAFAVLTEPFGDISSIPEGVYDETLIYPNPASKVFRINSSYDLSALRIFDLSGRLVESSFHRISNDSAIDISRLSGGLYLVEAVFINGEVKRSKLLVEK